ncbi:hypothetical protein [Ammoniphilus resinae]|uniref:Uncharacterized protein n=1 Tax=Ammoniphilus resinae TaxID=861532 RepID=A0ABS4GME1_9BACL|nr:hypothetical protein [Ammoniphilus resinae]MBP1931433.1 hypothetical protein [Ammoniphilus resinae]
MNKLRLKKWMGKDSSLLLYVYTAPILLYVISQFAEIPYLRAVIGITTLLALLLSLSYAKGLYLTSGILFLVAGGGLFGYNQLPLSSLILYFDQMLGLLSLFFVLPFINSIIRVGHYDKNLSILLQDKVTSLGKFYRRSFFVTHILSPLLLIATLPLIKNSLNVTLKELPGDRFNKFCVQSILRGYTLALMWSPMEVLVGTTLDITKSKYYLVIPIILFIVITAVLCDWAMSSFRFKGIELPDKPGKRISYKTVYKKIIQLISMLLVLVLLVTWTEQTLGKGYLFSVVLLIIPVSVIWAVLIGKSKRYTDVTLPYWKKGTKGLSNYFFMFTSAGFFVQMLSKSELLTYLEPVFTLASEKTFLFYLLIGGYFLLSAFLGFHPLVTLTLIGELLQPVLPHVQVIPLTVVLITSSLATAMYSPYNLSVSIMSDLLKVNSYRIGYWNLLFTLFFMLLSISIAYLCSYLY